MHIAASGSWSYGQTSKLPVYVIRLDYDWWHRLAEAGHELEAGERPDLNGDGYLFYVLFKEPPKDGSFWPDSIGFKSVGEAKEHASARVSSEIAWD